MARLLHNSHDDLDLGAGNIGRNGLCGLFIWIWVLIASAVSVIVGSLFALRLLLIVGSIIVGLLLLSIICTLVYMGMKARRYIDTYDDKEGA